MLEEFWKSPTHKTKEPREKYTGFESLIVVPVSEAVLAFVVYVRISSRIYLAHLSAPLSAKVPRYNLK